MNYNNSQNKDRSFEKDKKKPILKIPILFDNNSKKGFMINKNFEPFNISQFEASRFRSKKFK